MRASFHFFVRTSLVLFSLRTGLLDRVVGGAGLASLVAVQLESSLILLRIDQEASDVDEVKSHGQEKHGLAFRLED